MAIDPHSSSKTSRKKISLAFEKIILEESKVELLKEELVLCYDFNAKDLYEVIAKDPKQGLTIENLKLLREKLMLSELELKTEDLNTLLKRFGSCGRGIHRRINLEDFKKMMHP